MVRCNDDNGNTDNDHETDKDNNNDTYNNNDDDDDMTFLGNCGCCHPFRIAAQLCSGLVLIDCVLNRSPKMRRKSHQKLMMMMGAGEDHDDDVDADGGRRGNDSRGSVRPLTTILVRKWKPFLSCAGQPRG